MTSIPAREAQNRLDGLLDEVEASHEPICIQGNTSRGVLVSEDDWRAIQETLYLVSIPGMRETLIEGMNTPLDQCSKDPGW